MSPILLAALIGFVAGPVGAAIAVALGATVLRHVHDRIRGAALAFAGGFILAVAFMELIRRGIDTSGQWSVTVTLAGLVLGAGARAAVTRWVDRLDQQHSQPRAPAPPQANNSPNNAPSQQSAEGARQAKQIAISLAAVNLLEGLPVGVGFAVDQQVGLLIGAVMVFENFTEALSVTTELSREKQRDLVRLTLFAAAPTATLGIGAVGGALLGEVQPLMMAGLLGAGAGVMLYAVADDIVLDAHRLGPGAITTFPLLLGIVVGVALVALGHGSQA